MFVMLVHMSVVYVDNIIRINGSIVFLFFHRITMREVADNVSISSKQFVQMLRF